MATQGPDSQNWLAAAVTGGFGVLSHIVLWIVHRNKSLDGEPASDERIQLLHEEIAKLRRDFESRNDQLRRDFESFREDELRWQRAIDQRLLLIAQRLPYLPGGD
jgi:hypothetical protein